MTSDKVLSGGCLCGAVRFTATPKNNEVGVCHCSMCRRWGAGPLFAIDCADTFKAESDDQLSVYASSDWGERGFCRTCGTSLFWKMKDKGMYIVSVDAFDDPGALTFSHEIFIDEKPNHYEFANQTQKMTGAEVFAMFAGEDKDG